MSISAQERSRVLVGTRLGELDASAVFPVALVLPTLAVIGASEGGYFPSTWGWSAVLFASTALIALLVRSSVGVSRAQLAFVGTFVLFLGWTALSLIWTRSFPSTMLEIERTLSYVAFAVALIAVARRRHLGLVLASVLLAITGLAAYGLATRLFPGRLRSYDLFAGYRLAEPLGYWNGVGILCALGCIVATGLAARARNPVARGLAAASLLILAPTLFFTFSRGGIVALFLGLLVAVAADPNRLQYLFTLVLAAPWPAIAVWRASESKSLTTSESPLVTATHQGERLAILLLVLAAASFVTVAGVARLTRGVRATRLLRRAFAVIVVAAAVAASVGLVATHGGPSKLATEAYDSLRQTFPPAAADQTRRLFSLSPTGRVALWKSAYHAAEKRPILGFGAGTFQQLWLSSRPTPATARDAHSLFLEDAAEMGLVGAVLIAAVFVIALAAGWRARMTPLAPVGLGALAAYVGHASIDWDWELPVVTLSVLAVAWTVFVADSSTRRPLVLSPVLRIQSVALLGVVAAFAFVTGVGNRALGQARSATLRDDTAAVVKHARTAARWTPWSSEPLRYQADTALENGNGAQAYALYRRAIDKDPQNSELWLGAALSSTGRRQRIALDEVAKLNPQSPQLAQLRPKQ